MLVDHQITAECEKRNLVVPFRSDAVQPASIDMRLARTFRHYLNHEITEVDLADIPDGLTEIIEVQDRFVLQPGEFILGSTYETVNIPIDIVGKIDGKSSLGRLGLTVHVTAGFLDPGFRGNVTLEMVNLAPMPIILRPMYDICQVSFEYLDPIPDKPYQGRYQDAMGTEESRYGKEVHGPG